MRGLLASTVVGASFVAGVGPVAAANKAQLSVYQHGKPVGYLPCGTTPLLKRTAVLMGGGIDVKDAYSWMIAKMTRCRDGSTGRLGNFVVIRAGGNPSYDSFINKLGPVASVQTLVAPTIESANDPLLEPYIRNAGAIFLTGGDQGDYYNFWKGTLLERLVSEQVRNYGIPIGGTSAGMMILSEFNYIADPFTITSFDALHDPYTDGAVTLKRDFWTDRTPFPPLSSTVTDSHFDTRDRMGRLVTFLGRVIADKWANTSGARAIGVDQQTALLMEYSDQSASSSTLASYTVRTIANPDPDIKRAGYILNASSGSKLTVAPGQPLTFTNVQVQKLPVDGEPINYQINVNNGVMTSTTGSIY
jgi:cyanophycinase-like exopeptidase